MIKDDVRGGQGPHHIGSCRIFKYEFNDLTAVRGCYSHCCVNIDCSGSRTLVTFCSPGEKSRFGGSDQGGLRGCAREGMPGGVTEVAHWRCDFSVKC